MTGAYGASAAAAAAAAAAYDRERQKTEKGKYYFQPALWANSGSINVIFQTTNQGCQTYIFNLLLSSFYQKLLYLTLLD
jgi:predicted double-glycine peptidase